MAAFVGVDDEALVPAAEGPVHEAMQVPQGVGFK